MSKNYKYAEAVKFSNYDFETIAQSVVTKELKPAVLAYIANMMRVCSLLNTPPHLVQISSMNECFLMEADFNIYGRVGGVLFGLHAAADAW